MNSLILALVVQLVLCYVTVKIVQKYLPERDGKFVDAYAYVLVFGEGLLVSGIIQGHGISFVGLIVTFCAVNALVKKYKLRQKGLY